MFIFARSFSWLLALIFFLPVSYAASSLQPYFEHLKSDPDALYQFLKEMPKGGELHYHLMGGAYPELMLSFAKEDNYCLDKQTFHMMPFKQYCKGVMTRFLTPTNPWYQKTLRAWSLQDFDTKHRSAHDHFFAAFYKFYGPFMAYEGRLLAQVIQRAAEQHEHYLEVMLPIPEMPEGSLTEKPLPLAEMPKRREALLQSPQFQESVKRTVQAIERLKQEAHHLLGCEHHPDTPACQVKIKFQYHALREQPFPMMFAQALQGFLAASQSPDIVAVNLVQAEDSLSALEDYPKQMAAFGFLHQHYPKVHIALHAGELAEGTKPQDRRFHIHDAIYKGFAERIGHGVDIKSENNYEALLRHMATVPIPIEVSLTSNDYLLNISGKTHPIYDYLKYGVPIVLSTDDEGILRTSLTQEYIRAAQEHHMTYDALKLISRNALTYSFLPGKSIWRDANSAEPVDACKSLESQTCLNFIAQEEKAKTQWALEQDFAAFEKRWLKHFTSHQK